MSLKRTTAPPTQKRAGSSRSSEKGLIAKDRTTKQSAKRKPVLDNRFHRTIAFIERSLPELRAGFTQRTAERRAACPKALTACERRAAVRNRSARRLGRRATIRRLDSLSEELASRVTPCDTNDTTRREFDLLWHLPPLFK